MKKLLLLAAIILSSCAQKEFKNKIKPVVIEMPGINSLSIRALEVAADSLVALSASGSTFAYSKDMGNTWTVKKIDTLNLEYRSLAILDSALIVVNVGSPAKVLRSVDFGDSWETVYIDTSANAFYNSIKFSNNKNGIISGDPQEGCLSILKSKDAGKTWFKQECEDALILDDGEAQFAASNTCIEYKGSNIWIATGGKNSRIIKSSDNGGSWKSIDVDFIKGKEMTGIYSVDFYDEKRGVIVGGDWHEMCSNDYNKLYTLDGGETWIDEKDFNVGYLSCAQYKPDSDAEIIYALSKQGIARSLDGGKIWEYISNEKDLYTFRFQNDSTIIAAGKGKLVRLNI